MRCGFKFNNHHSNEYGVTVRTKSRPIRPSVKTFYSDSPYCDGEYDFTEANGDKREHYNSRVFTVSLSLTANNLTELQGKISKISLWLGGKGELVFDDIPHIVWRGRVTDEVIYMPNHGGTTAMMEVSFRVSPFGKGTFDTKGPQIGMPLEIGYSLPIGLDELYTYTVSGSGDIKVINFGDVNARPVIDIEGNGGSVTLTLGDKSLTFKCGAKVSVDFERQLILDGDNNLVKATGDFFELCEGENIIHLTSTTENPLAVTVTFTPEYMYSVDYNENRWGEDHA